MTYFKNALTVVRLLRSGLTVIFMSAKNVNTFFATNALLTADVLNVPQKMLKKSEKFSKRMKFENLFGFKKSLSCRYVMA
jgi:hypothetical protein